VDFARQSLRELTADARRYGLHATLKAPFFLRPGRTEDELLLSAARFITGRQSIVLPRLELARIGSFFALVPAAETPGAREAIARLNAFAMEAVVFFDPFRAAPSGRERARREAQTLNARQKALLADWGYPYVFDEYRFHVTLAAKPHDNMEAGRVEESLRACFAQACNEGTTVSGICVCRQATPAPAARTGTQPENRDSAFTPVARFSFR
jgi:hypothetical protein